MNSARMHTKLNEKSRGGVRDNAGRPGKYYLSKLVRIAVVDDDESVRTALESLLRSLGYSVGTFGSAKAFLESNAIQSASCLIIDIHMPEMSGPDLQRRLCASGHRTPIIFITGRPDDATRARVIADGAVGYLAKPTRQQTLIALLNQALIESR